MIVAELPPQASPTTPTPPARPPFDFLAAQKVAHIATRRWPELVAASGEQPEDLEHDLVVKLYEQQDDYNPARSRYPTWATQFCHRRLIDKARQMAPTTRSGNQRRGRVGYVEELPETPHDTTNSHNTDIRSNREFVILAGTLRAVAATIIPPRRRPAHNSLSDSQAIAIVALQLLFNYGCKAMRDRLKADIDAQDALLLANAPSVSTIYLASWRFTEEQVTKVIKEARKRIRGAQPRPPKETK